MEYGTTTAYGSVSVPENTFRYVSHYQVLSGLTPGRLYHFRVKSGNVDGNVAVSGDYTFTTLAATPTPTPTVAPTPIPPLQPMATPVPTATPTPTPTASAGVSVMVTTVPALLTALADNTVTDIVVANGTYRTQRPGFQSSN